MKQIVMLMSLMIGALCLVLLPKATALNASAATPLLLRYSSSGHWSYQLADTWVETDNGRDIYYLAGDGYLKDGIDAVIVASEDEATIQKEELTLNVNLNSLTFSPGASAIVYAKSVTDCYVCTNATGIVNGNVTNARVYDYGRGQFNGNVTNLYVIAYSYEFHTNITCTGTVSYLKMDCNVENGKMLEYYDFETNKLRISEGSLTTSSDDYSTTPSTASGSTASTTTTAAAGEYDDVPKTGEADNTAALLLGAAFICILGALCLKKSTTHTA